MALQLYEQILKDYPDLRAAHMFYGHTLKSVGRLRESIDQYRKAIDSNAGAGEAYWSLANLKTYRFTNDDIARMLVSFDPDSGDPDDQSHLAFALGKAYEDRDEFDLSFEYYSRGNAIRGRRHKHNAKQNIYDTARQIKCLDTTFFSRRERVGYSAPDPIFVVGLPRAGSTLVEQILASHSKVQGTAELHEIITITRKLSAATPTSPAGQYPEILAKLTTDQFLELEESYIRSSNVHRNRETPYFVDKMPNNFRHIGLIHLILPNSKIIDARRHPMACCFSCFKQLFASGQTFTYDLRDLGYYYRDYVKLMDHWDEVLPGRVLRVQHEDMVTDTEAQIRRLLEYCDLEFEEQCLRFYDTRRAIRTPSSEQVRQPMFLEGLVQWRSYEKYLDPLKEALGPVLDRYPI